MRAVRGVLLALVVPLAGGCVERWLLIRSDPPGAQVYLDAHPLGPAPVRIPFEHYGSREVLARLVETPAAGPKVHYASAVEVVTLDAPWYQWFPIDLVAEFLVPWTWVDEHEITVHMRRFEPTAARSELDQLLQSSAQRLMVDMEAAEGVPSTSGGERP